MDTSSLPASPVNQRNSHSNNTEERKKQENADVVDTDVKNQFDNKATKNTKDLSDAKKDEDQKRTEDLETSTNLSDKQPPKRDETSSFQNEVV